ncbi:MAG: family 1 glycosylhydrolase [Chthoniobacterales bacterium]
MQFRPFSLSPVLPLAVIAIAMTSCIAPPKTPKVTDAQRAEWAKVKTGKFAWGVSTSSYQYENPDLKPTDEFSTDWDVLIADGAAPKKGNAVWSWSDWDKDLVAIKKLGLTHYRFSVEWGRIEPQPGVYDEEVLARYVSWAKRLKANGVEPVVCLWHFTFPDWLYDKKHPAKSNWLHPQFSGRWKAFTKKVVAAMGPTVRFYAPQNEPNGQITTAYIGGMWPPMEAMNFGNYNRAIKVSAQAFRDAAAIIKQENPRALVLSVEALPWWKKPPFVWTWFYNFMEHNNFDHLDQVYDVCDVIGFNYYYSQTAGPVSMLLIGSHHGPNFTEMGWDIDPNGLYEQIRTVGARYGKPMMITENGIATADDKQRIKYLQEHLAAIAKAKAGGSDVRGYFHWSLADNYEWHFGYTATFGLSHMDPKTKDRILKPSALYYRDIIRIHK